ncbi:hypothetical protein [Microbacterium sp. NPDC090003]|uniref:hypothetical protein n=1 Tax=Microbacterium sp. NPDC090003 TaxID=3364203 RepID=UPI0037F82738
MPKPPVLVEAPTCTRAEVGASCVSGGVGAGLVPGIDLTGYGVGHPSGLYLAAAGCLLAIVSAIVVSWVALVEVLR